MLGNQLQKNTSFITLAIQKEIKMLRPDQRERLLKLGEGQLAIAEKWDKEREERGKLFDKIAEYFGKPEYEEQVSAMVKQISDDTPDRCEHDRSIWSPCSGCEEIEQALTPEFYDENGDRLDDDAIDAIVDSDPEKYGIPKDK